MKYADNVKKDNIIAFTIIKNAIQNNHVSHAYLFSAPEGQIIENEWKFVVQELLSTNTEREPLNYPDLHIVDGSSGIIKKDEIILAVERMQQTALDQEGKKFIIIKNIEFANKQSINSLLKFLEEPTKDTYILMTTNMESSVLSTIKSRSQIIKLKPKNKKAIMNELLEAKVDKEDALILSNIFSSSQQSLSSYDNEFKQIKNVIVNAMEEVFENKHSLYNNLYKKITKTNYGLFLKVLSEFYSDIWKDEMLQDISFINQEKIIQKYVLSKFEFEKALRAINGFLYRRKFNINFELDKTKLLLELKEIYED